jgi:hypothetical protein
MHENETSIHQAKDQPPSTRSKINHQTKDPRPNTKPTTKYRALKDRDAGLGTHRGHQSAKSSSFQLQVGQARSPQIPHGLQPTNHDSRTSMCTNSGGSEHFV